MSGNIKISEKIFFRKMKIKEGAILQRETAPSLKILNDVFLTSSINIQELTESHNSYTFRPLPQDFGYFRGNLHLQRSHL